MALCGNRGKIITVLPDIEECYKLGTWLKQSDIISGMDTLGFSSIKDLETSGNLYTGDVYIVECNSLNGIDGRLLYDLQKENRIELVPFLFIVDRDLSDSDYTYFSEKYLTNVFDYITKPVIENQFKHKMSHILSFMSSADNSVNTHEDYFYTKWKKSILEDRKRLRSARESWNNFKKSI